MCWHRPIFPGRFQPSILGTDELNFRVRNGNGWTLAVKDTDYTCRYAPSGKFLLFPLSRQKAQNLRPDTSRRIVTVYGLIVCSIYRSGQFFELIERERRKSHESK